MVWTYLNCIPKVVFITIYLSLSLSIHYTLAELTPVPPSDLTIYNIVWVGGVGHKESEAEMSHVPKKMGLKTTMCQQCCRLL